ncbi:DUF2945 domain-containing protein [Amycolatopsis carbonis]|uniref:DUF2945 domain-containing protein n=1 Tax=Amycolatopsis carbonis TaxID=715471 RepID=UPI003DA7987C
MGTVEGAITSDTEASRRKVKASPGAPRCLVRSEKSGRTAVHHPNKIRPGLRADSRRARRLKPAGAPRRLYRLSRAGRVERRRCGRGCFRCRCRLFRTPLWRSVWRVSRRRGTRSWRGRSGWHRRRPQRR